MTNKSYSLFCYSYQLISKHFAVLQNRNSKRHLCQNYKPEMLRYFELLITTFEAKVWNGTWMMFLTDSSAAMTKCSAVTRRMKHYTLKT
jgi:hypothetical protein